MAVFKKRRNREIIWGQENKVREDCDIPKPEVILGPAGDSGMNPNVVNENAMGFLGTMAAAASSESAGSVNSEERPRSSAYGWEPGESASSPASSSSSYSISEDSDSTDKIFRLQRKIDNLVERIEILERKMRGENQY